MQMWTEPLTFSGLRVVFDNTTASSGRDDSNLQRRHKNCLEINLADDWMNYDAQCEIKEERQHAARKLESGRRKRSFMIANSVVLCVNLNKHQLETNVKAIPPVVGLEAGMM